MMMMMMKLHFVLLCVSVELRSMLTVPVYTLSLVAAVFAAFLLAGYRTNAARFVQLQYGYEYQHAWFYTNGSSLMNMQHFVTLLIILGCPSVAKFGAKTG